MYVSSDSSFVLNLSILSFSIDGIVFLISSSLTWSSCVEMSCKMVLYLRRFEFVIPEIKVTRNDDLNIRETILNMTPEERRKLGINRNTLWYVKQNLLQGKKIKIYDKVKEIIV